MEYLSPQGVLLPLVYGTTASPLWLELRGHSAWQVTPSWTVYRLACHRLLPWLRVTFAMVPDAAWPGSDQWPWSTAPATGPVGRLGRPSASDPWGIGSFLSLGRPTCVQCPGPLGPCSPGGPRGLLWLKVLPWVVDGAGGLGAGKTSGAGTRGVDLNAAIGARTGYADTNGGESSNNRSKVHADCYPAENPSL